MAKSQAKISTSSMTISSHSIGGHTVLEKAEIYRQCSQYQGGVLDVALHTRPLLLVVRSSITPMIEYQLTMALHSAIRMAFPPADAVAIAIGGKDMSWNVPLTCIVVTLLLN